MPPASRILLCDHRALGLADRARTLAGAGYDVRTAHSVVESLASLEREPPDVLLLDPWLEGGARELAEIRARTPATTACLLVAGPEALAGPLREARAAASPLFDVLRRDASDEELHLRVERLLLLGRELVQRLELEHKASHDDRTDLLRPDAFQRRLAEHVSAAGRHRFELALLILDLDGFGQVNKQWDHTVGDLVIGKVGERIRQNLRQEDVAGRLGGDEFAVLLPYTAKIEAAHAVRRLRDEIGRLTPLLAARVPGLSVSASLGFETFDGEDLDSVETLRQHAEIALREAKKLGGGQALYFRSLPPRDPRA